MSKNVVIGFLDASSPQSTANTQRVWFFTRTRIIKNTSKFRANTFGIYSPNGNSILTFRDHSKKEDICEVLSEFKVANPGKRIMIILDNFSSHRSQMVRDFSAQNGIELIFLPPYSPDLNPIEQIWRAVRRDLSTLFIKDLDHLKAEIWEEFFYRINQITYFKGWAEKFLSAKYYFKMLCN